MKEESIVSVTEMYGKSLCEKVKSELFELSLLRIISKWPAVDFAKALFSVNGMGYSAWSGSIKIAIYQSDQDATLSSFINI